MKNSIITAIAAVLISTNSQADDYTVVGANCVPEGGAMITGNQYYSGSSYLTPNPGVTSEVIFYCGIPTDISAPSAIGMLYLSTANTGTNFVKASYVKMNRTTGVITTVDTATSQNGPNNNTLQIVTETFTDTYNISTYAYYLRIALRRDAGKDVVFYGLALY